MNFFDSLLNATCKIELLAGAVFLGVTTTVHMLCSEEVACSYLRANAPVISTASIAVACLGLLVFQGRVHAWINQE
jgi:hypothetical protein